MEDYFTKKCLILFSALSQTHLIERLVSEMQEKGIKLEALNTVNWFFVGNDKELPFFYQRLKRIFSIPILGKVIRKLFLTRMLKEVTKDYDCVDVQFFTRNYIGFLNNIKKPFKITVWGSDFYRTTERDSVLKRPIYRKAKIVQTETPDVKKDLIVYEPSIEDRIIPCNFGVDLLDEIEELRKQSINHGDKIIITCGYNGGAGQQHIKMFEAICRLPKEVRERLFVYVPVTYGLTQDYKQQLEDFLKRVDFEYSLIENRLTNEELASLRLNTDIAINIQLSDSLSSSLLQHLFAGNLLLLGEWLPQGVYNEYNLFYKTTSINNVTENILDCINNLNAYKQQSSINPQKVLSFASWQAVSSKQCEIYKLLLS